MSKPEQTPSHLPAAGAVEHGYPEGHLGHLTEKELQALDEFKIVITDRELYKPGSSASPASHDDATLLRYLRARKWVVQDAAQQFSETEAFRKANDLDVLYNTIDIDSYEESRSLYPRFTGRRDKRGIPIYVYQIRHLDSSTVAKYEKSAEATYSEAKPESKTPQKLLRLCALYENLTRFAQPLASQCTDRPHTQTPITLSTNVVDISGVSLRQFWNLKAHMQSASVMATSHYPETLDRIFIIGAPVFFSTVWSWIKRWFDPVTVSKIFILNPSDVFPTLTSFIDTKNIPKAYGGDMEWDFFDLPKLDSEFERLVSWDNGYTEIPTGPVYWRPCAEDPTRLELIAAGSKDKKIRSERVCRIPIALPEAAKAAKEGEKKEKDEEKTQEETYNTTEKLENLAISEAVPVTEEHVPGLSEKLATDSTTASTETPAGVA